MYARILVALDSSRNAERVLPHAEALARQFGSEVILLQATTPLEEVIANTSASAGAIIPVAPPIDPMPIVEAEQAGAATYLEGIARSLRSTGLRVECAHPQGHAASAIVELAREREADLIAMTTHGRGGLGRLVYGSVADEVLRTASCPILLVRITDADGGSKSD